MALRIKGPTPMTPRSPSRTLAIQPREVKMVTAAAMTAVQPRPEGFSKDWGSTRPSPPLTWSRPGAAEATLRITASSRTGLPPRTMPATAKPVVSRPVTEKNMLKPMPALSKGPCCRV